MVGSRGPWSAVMLSMTAVAAVGGCASVPPPLSANEAAGPGDGSYQLGSGDKLRIAVFNEANLTGEYAVSPAGTIAFPLIGSVNARDVSIDALQDAIRGKLANGFVANPSVSVEVLNYRPFYILGEVGRPGEYPYAAGLTIEQAIAAAGGYTYRANRHMVFLRRARSDGERSVNLRGRTVAILPGDTLRVGERYF